MTTYTLLKLNISLLTLVALIVVYQIVMERRRKPRKVIRLVISRVEIKQKPKEQESKMQVQLRTSQYALITVAPVDADNNPAPLDGGVAATVRSGDAKVRVIDNNIYLIPSDVPGKSVIEISGDAQQGEGVDVISEVIELDAIAPNAVKLNAGFTLGNKADLAPE